MSEFRLLIVLLILTLGLLGYAVLRSELSTAARGCRAAGGTWQEPQQTCVWEAP